MRSAVLVHPPLLGPGSLRPLAAELTAAGHPVVLPDLRSTTRPPTAWWDRASTLCVTAAGQATSGTAPATSGAPGGSAAAAGPAGSGFLVVGYSGAGVLLPLVAERLGAVGPVEAVVFVDAIVPAERGASEASDGIRSFVATLPVEDGLLPPWTSWWGDAIAELVPDAEQRAQLAADTPRLTPDFWSEPVPVPPAWPADRARYVRLSPPYAGDADEAARRGWPVLTREGTHLDPFLHPADVAALVLEVAGATA